MIIRVIYCLIEIYLYPKQKCYCVDSVLYQNTKQCYINDGVCLSII